MADLITDYWPAMGSALILGLTFFPKSWAARLGLTKIEPISKSAAGDKSECVRLLSEIGSYYEKHQVFRVQGVEVSIPPRANFADKTMVDDAVDRLIEMGVLEESFVRLGDTKQAAIAIKLRNYIEDHTIEETRAHSKRLHARESITA